MSEKRVGASGTEGDGQGGTAETPSDRPALSQTGGAEGHVLETKTHSRGQCECPANSGP